MNMKMKRKQQTPFEICKIYLSTVKSLTGLKINYTIYERLHILIFCLKKIIKDKSNYRRHRTSWFRQSLTFHSEKDGACREMEETGPVLLPGFVNFSSDTTIIIL
jgi:hypothetical protein